MKAPEGNPFAKLTIWGEREFVCRVKWPEGMTAEERDDFLATVAKEMDRVMRELP